MPPSTQIAAFYLRDERLRLTRLQQQRLRRLAEEAPWLLPLTRRQLQKVLATSGGTACICEADPALAPDKEDPGTSAAPSAVGARACSCCLLWRVTLVTVIVCVPGSTTAVHAPAPPDFDALLIEFPRFAHPVVFEEKPYDSSPFAATLSAASFDATAQRAVVGGVGGARSPGVGKYRREVWRRRCAHVSAERCVVAVACPDSRGTCACTRISGGHERGT